MHRRAAFSIGHGLVCLALRWRYEITELAGKCIVAKTRFKKARGPAQDGTFSRNKHELTSTPGLILPDFLKSQNDTSQAGAGSFLAQPSRDFPTAKDLDIIV